MVVLSIFLCQTIGGNIVLFLLLLWLFLFFLPQFVMNKLFLVDLFIFQFQLQPTLLSLVIFFFDTIVYFL